MTKNPIAKNLKLNRPMVIPDKSIRKQLKSLMEAALDELAELPPIDDSLTEIEDNKVK